MGQKTNPVIAHYDALIEEGNDPVLDAAPLREYMDKYDGKVFLENLMLGAEKEVLEIGVGTGRMAVRAAPLCKKFTGVDFSEKTLERAKNHLTSKNIELICADFLEYEFSDQFDVIYSTLTFMHIAQKQRAYEKVYSLLKKQGRFVLSVEKNQREALICGTRTIKLYPDQPSKTKSGLSQAGFCMLKEIETELAYIFVAEKR